MAKTFQEMRRSRGSGPGAGGVFSQGNRSGSCGGYLATRAITDIVASYDGRDSIKRSGVLLSRSEH